MKSCFTTIAVEARQTRRNVRSGAYRIGANSRATGAP